MNAAHNRVNGYITKPVTRVQLKDCLDRYLAQRRKKDTKTGLRSITNRFRAFSSSMPPPVSHRKLNKRRTRRRCQKCCVVCQKVEKLFLMPDIATPRPFALGARGSAFSFVRTGRRCFDAWSLTGYQLGEGRRLGQSQIFGEVGRILRLLLFQSLWRVLKAKRERIFQRSIKNRWVVLCLWIFAQGTWCVRAFSCYSCCVDCNDGDEEKRIFFAGLYLR